MTLSQSFSQTKSFSNNRAFSRFGAFIGALAVTAGVVAIPATPAQAAGARYYTLELAQPAEAKQAIIRGVMFKCVGTTCGAPMVGSSPRNVCISAAKEFGQVVSFKAGNRVLDDAALSTCNAKIKVNIAKD